MASPQATEAAARKRRERVAALGAVTLPDAAAARGIDVTTMQKWAPRSESAFRGRQRMWLFRDTELDAELEQWRCTWEDGCPEFALLSTSSPRRCKRHAAAVPRRGMLSATEFAEKHGIDPTDLVAWLEARLEAGEVLGERVDRGGRHAGWLLDEAKVLAILDAEWRCRWHKGCPNYGVGPTRHCGDHAGAATQIANAAGKVRVTCPECGDVREDYPSQARAGELCTHHYPRADRVHEAVREAREELIASRKAAGRVPIKVIAAKWHLAPTSSLATRLVRLGIAHERQHGLLLFDQSDVRRDRVKRYESGDGRFRAAPQSRDPKRLSVVRGAFGASYGERGGRPGLTDAERARVLEMTAEGKSQQQIANVLAGERRVRVIAAAAEAGLPNGLAIDAAAERLDLPRPEVARDAVGRVQRASKAVRNPS